MICQKDWGPVKKCERKRGGRGEGGGDFDRG